MTRTLLLLRHGKSEWGQNVEDHDRPLAKRGKRDALRMGVELGARGLFPELILSSTARRARSTARRVVEASSYAGEVHYESSLYATNVLSYLEAIATLPDAIQTALVIGHNPLLEELVALLTGQATVLPTAALACIDLPITSWDDVRRGATGTVRFVLVASQLPG